MWQYIVLYVFIHWGIAPCNDCRVSYKYDTVSGDTVKVYKLTNQLIEEKVQKRFDTKAEAIDLYKLALKNFDTINKPKKDQRKIIYLKLDSVFIKKDTLKK